MFGRDRLLNITHKANWEFIRTRKQNLINKNNKRENSKRIPYTYSVGEQILLKRGTENKYETLLKGPYTVLKVNDNGTICIQQGSVEDTVNIRRVHPYCTRRSNSHGGECSAPPLRRSQRRLN